MAGDIMTYHEWRDGLGQRVILKLCHWQHVTYYTTGVAAAVRGCLFCGQRE